MEKERLNWKVMIPFLTIIMLTVSGLLGQESQSRTEEIEKVREAKAKALKPEEATKAENFLRKFIDGNKLQFLQPEYKGLRPKFGNMVNGAGFAAGIEYFRDDFLNGALTARAAAQLSTRAYQKYEAQATFPKLANDKLVIDLIASHRNFAGLNFYGNGPTSRESGRSNYRLEDTSFDAIAGFSPSRFWKLGTSSGALLTNVGPGADKRFISSDLQYSPNVAPGIDQQTDFLRYSVFTQIDYRNNPTAPKSGGNYVIQHSWYRDVDLKRFDFRRLDVDLEQHIPFLNRTRRLVLRAKGVFTETDNNKPVPFYLQPIVGGSDDLRGYRFFRFTDRNAVVYNAEYRWEIFSGMDGALFFDAGKVMPRRSLLKFSDLETSAGFGLRFNARNATFLRLDVGFSQEGFQVWFKFNDFLNNRKFGTNTLQPTY